jgi:D-glycero-alpha-D-manno-heptose-7-phosphate kinase
MTVVVREAPCRIDLAGGTIDLWPLYLYLGNLELVQMALNLKAKAVVSFDAGPKNEILIESSDYERKIRFNSLPELRASLKKSPKANPLRWLCRVAEFFLSRSGQTGYLTLKTSSQVPPGSGLGGSSTLGIAMGQALAEALGDSLAKTPWVLQQTIRDLEAVEIEHPAGDQDYVPALFGGLLVFKLGPGSRAIERLPEETAAKISSRSALIYTGKPHHSGLNNWQIFRAAHEGKRVPLRGLQKIQKISADMAAALRRGDFENFEKLVNAEWTERQKLARAVNAPVLKEAWDFAKKYGARARKACGAGGGGCLYVYFSDPDKCRKFLNAPVKRGWKIFRADTSPAGVVL